MLPPGPRAPAVVQIARWAFRPIPFLRSAKRRYGTPFTFRFPQYPPIVVIDDPGQIREMFAGDPEQLYSGSSNQLLKPMLGARSLILLDGADHRGQRRLLMPPFHGDRMRAYGETMREIVDAELDTWPVGETFPLLARMQSLTFDIILRTVFGVQDPARMDLFRDRLLRMLRFTGNPGTLLMVNGRGEVRGRWLEPILGRWSPQGRYAKLKEDVDRLLDDEITTRRAVPSSRDRSDVLSMLLVAEDSDGRGLTDEELRDQLITLLVAGHETTATALAWVFHRILSQPDVLDRLLDELDGASEGHGEIDPAGVAKLPYLEAVIKETARLHPVLPFVVRHLQSPYRLGEFDLPAGWIVAPNIWLTHRRPDVWPDPENFDPGRFMDPTNKPGPFEFFPFGGGNRTCIGMAFAYFEMKVVIGTVLARLRDGERGAVRLATETGYVPAVVRRNITLAPSRGMPVTVAPAGQIAAAPRSARSVSAP